MLRTHPETHPSVVSILRQAEQSIVGTQYCFDFDEGISVLESRVRTASVKVRVLLDKNQQSSTTPSCKTQLEKVKRLQAWGVEFKMFKPPGAGFACLHAKTWLCDGLVYVGGSANFTNNSLNNSQENIVIIKEDEFVTSYLAWFEGLWARAEEVP